jgi:hypothetical protein
LPGDRWRYTVDPLDGGPVSVYQGDAEFGFTSDCEMETKKNRPRGVITYHEDSSFHHTRERPGANAVPGN